MAGYDAIGEKYLLVKEIPTAVVECSNLHVALAPYIKGARVLDLACGTGYYSTLLLEWGASAVVGIDLSPAMIDAAEKRREALPPNVREALQYRVGDAISLGKVDDEGFDLVVGAWLLNYAGTQAELEGMLAAIAQNLRGPNGVFVGISTPPIGMEELDEYAAWNNRTAERKKERLRMELKYREGIRGEGWTIDARIFGENAEVVAAFSGFHLATEVYSAAAKRAGMGGLLEWMPVKPWDEVREEALKRNEEGLFREYFDELGPHFGVVVIEKGE